MHRAGLAGETKITDFDGVDIEWECRRAKSEPRSISPIKQHKKRFRLSRSLLTSAAMEVEKKTLSTPEKTKPTQPHRMQQIEHASVANFRNTVNDVTAVGSKTASLGAAFLKG